MNFDFTTEQKILKESAHKLLSKKCTSEVIRELAANDIGFSGELWSIMAELGWMGLLIPEEYGGSGPDFLDMSIVLGEMGYFGYSGPFFSSSVMGTMAVLEAGSESLKREILPDIADGRCKLTLAWLEAGGSYAPETVSLSAKKDNGFYTLSGSKLFVEQAHLTDLFVCVARTSDQPSGISLFLVDKQTEGLTIQSLKTLADDRLFEISFDALRIPESKLLGKPNRAMPVLENLLLKSAVAKAAEMCGGAQRVMDLVIPHVKGRKQFGKPVGAFQATQHHCSNMLTYLETMKYITYQAAWRITKGLPFEMEASICKTWTSDAYRKLVALGHQVMGGIGFMEEIDLQIYFRNAKSAQLKCGDADFHRERIAVEMGL